MSSYSKNILILYYELAEYTLACIRELAHYGKANIHVVRYPLNKEAPFQFNLTIPGVTFYNRRDLSSEALMHLVKKINPEVTYCGGWMDKGYIQAIEGLRKNGKSVLLAFDNHWRGDVKQQLSALYFKVRYRKLFTHCFIPGQPQKIFAQKLGFKENEIFTGVYSADVNAFEKVYREFIAQKENNLPHVFVYAARYYTFKGITDLWEAFIQLKNEVPNDWQLWCLGTGDVAPVEHPHIKHFGFVQPNELKSIMGNASVYVLPSRFEPWAVSVHEFAAAGFPLVLSSQVGARFAFLENGINGFQFTATDISSLKEAMKQIISKSNTELITMSKKSNQLAKKISPSLWAEVFVHLLES